MLTIEYTSAVKTPAGHRSVTIRAKAESITEKMAKVVEVLAIDGEKPARNMSRTGANRQAFSGTWVAEREVGAKKRLSACVVKTDA